ncbi:MAG TPA: hypothetical protein VMB49_15195 [Acidobacteriaceae bacterium]|nr:hypothetical protein [Acidobacteriaceae bacterium]
MYRVSRATVMLITDRSEMRLYPSWNALYLTNIEARVLQVCCVWCVISLILIVLICWWLLPR